MRTVYVYVLETMADWEIGYITAELHSKRYFKKDATITNVKTVSCSKEPIKTMGGLTIIPDCVIENIVMDSSTVLLLPGADTWSDSKNLAVLQKASELLAIGATVCAICGATVALANMGILNNRKHTSNGTGFLELFVQDYNGSSFYVDEPSVADDNLITAGSTAGLLWAKQILERLDVFQPNTLEAWFKYFSYGKAADFFELMQSIQ